MQMAHGLISATLIFHASTAGATLSQVTDSLTIDVTETAATLEVSFRATQTTSTPICAPDDDVFVWNEDETGYRYYMIGREGRRENIWVGVGHAENTGRDYLMISIRNLEGQFGDFYPQNLVMNFRMNGRDDPGVVEDGGLGIYPIRTIHRPGPSGVEAIVASSSYYELTTNHFLLRFNLENDFFRLRDLQARHVAVDGDGEIRVKLLKSVRAIL